MNREEVKDLYRNRKVVKNIIAAGIENVILDIDAIFDCNLNKIEYKVSYTHGYCGVRLRDCVRLNYKKAGISNVKAKIISQSIKCEPGCPVTEKAVFTTKLWR